MIILTLLMKNIDFREYYRISAETFGKIGGLQGEGKCGIIGIESEKEGSAWNLSIRGENSPAMCSGNR